MNAPLFSLLIDTSTERGIVALFRESETIAQKDLPFGYQSSHSLLPFLLEMFDSLHLNPSSLAYVTVGIGPGSYTGIRVGVVVAKTLAFARGIPLIGVCSLLGFVPQQLGKFAAILDAKIGGVYIMKGEKKSETVLFSEPELCSLSDFEAKLHDVEYLVSPNLSLLRPKIEQLYPNRPWKWEERPPDPIQMATKAAIKYCTQTFDLDNHLDLLYLRKTQAEIEKKKS